MSRHDEGDGFTSADRNLLRTVAGYGDTPVTARDICRSMGISRQAASAQAALLAKCGLLTMQVLSMGRCYKVSAAGKAELEAHKTALLLVEVDDRMADDVAAYLGGAGAVIGVRSVEDHGGGCCCQHCPHRGNCRG